MNLACYLGAMKCLSAQGPSLDIDAATRTTGKAAQALFKTLTQLHGRITQQGRCERMATGNGSCCAGSATGAAFISVTATLA